MNHLYSPWPRRTIVVDPPAPQRNELCPCGSGRKYKKCHEPVDSMGAPCSPKFWEETDGTEKKVV